MAQAVELLPNSVPENSSVSDMYTAGYRAKRTGKHCGKVRDPDGTIVVLNVLTGSCSCTPRNLRVANCICIHVRIFTALLCVQIALRAAKQSAETLTDTPCR